MGVGWREGGCGVGSHQGRAGQGKALLLGAGRRWCLDTGDWWGLICLKIIQSGSSAEQRRAEQHKAVQHRIAQPFRLALPACRPAGHFLQSSLSTRAPDHYSLIAQHQHQTRPHAVVETLEDLALWTVDKGQGTKTRLWTGDWKLGTGDLGPRGCGLGTWELGTGDLVAEGTGK